MLSQGVSIQSFLGFVFALSGGEESARELGARLHRGWHQDGVSDIEAWIQSRPKTQVVASETA
jgi:hypothetical protein